MIKKFSKVIIFTLIALFFVLVTPTFARTFNLDKLGAKISEQEPTAVEAYVIGNYVFTSQHPLTPQDIMLAARSIQLTKTYNHPDLTDSGDIYGEMAIHKLEIEMGDDFTPTGKITIGDNKVGTTELSEDEIEVKYIDYKYVPEVYKVTFDENYETGKTTPVEVDENTKIPQEKIPAPKRDDYKFDYWYKDQEDTPFDFETEIKEAITLKAKWSLLPTGSTTMPETATVGEESTEYGVKVDQVNDFEGKMVYGTFTITRNGEDARDLVDLQYYETAGEAGWKPLNGNTFGPADGFPLQAVESKFKYQYKEAGEYKVVIEIRDRKTDEVYITIEKTITVDTVKVKGKDVVDSLTESLESLSETYTIKTDNNNITITVNKGKLDDDPRTNFETVENAVKQKLTSVKDYIESVTIKCGDKTLNSVEELESFMQTKQKNEELVGIGQIEVTINLKENQAEFEENGTRTYTFNIKFVEIVIPTEFAENVQKLIKDGAIYTHSYDNDRKITINIEKPQQDLTSVFKENMLNALKDMLNNSVRSLEITIKDGAEILKANREDLETYDIEWLEGKLSAQGITNNIDLVDKELSVKVNLDENAKVEITGGNILVYNIVFTADKYTVTYNTDNGSESTTKTVVKDAKAEKPETDPVKEGYEFKYWAIEGKEGEAYNFETPVTADLKLKAIYNKEVGTDALVKSAVKGISSNDFTASYTERKITIDITGIDTKLADVKNTNIMVELGKILKAEGVKSVTVEYDKEEPIVYDNAKEPVYNEMKEKLTELLNTMSGDAKDLYGLVDKELKVTIEVEKDADTDESTVEYTVNFTSDYVRATNKDTLKAALSGEKGHIVIENSFEVDEDIEVNRNVTILNYKEKENEITRKNNTEEESHIFKITGEGIDVTLENLKLKGASSAVLVENGATVTVNELKYDEENYNKPAITVKTEGKVNNESRFTRVDKPYKITKGVDYDTLTKIEDTINYYIEKEHSKLYIISFVLKDGVCFKCYMSGEVIEIPECASKPYYDLKTNKEYTIKEWKKKGSTESVKNFGTATEDTTYYAQYEEKDCEVVKSKEELTSKISNNSGKPIIIESNETIQIDNLNITTSGPVTLVGEGDVTLKGTITASSQVTSLSLNNLKIVGDGNGNQMSRSGSDPYYIIKSEAKQFSMYGCTISNEAEGKEAYSAIYLPVANVVADIRGNTFKVDNIYNTIQFGPGCAVASGTTISDNKFVGTNTHNHINIYTVQENAIINIENNSFDVSANAIRLSNTTGKSAKFVISDNTYEKTDSITEYAGFIVMQLSGSGKDADDFSKYEITAKDNKGLEGRVLTADKTDNRYRFEYYASADGKQVGNNNMNGANKNAKVTFKNTAN